MTGDQVRVGDILVFLGVPHLIEAIHDFDRFRVAEAADGWVISLWPDVSYEVRRAA